LDSRFDGREFDFRWVTVFRRANHRCISPGNSGKLNLLPSVGREISTSQSAVMLCASEVKAGVVIPLTVKRVGGR